LSGFKQKITKILEIPPEIFGVMSSVTINSDIELRATECEKIISYSDTEVKLLLCDTIITVFGSGLTLKAFFGNEMTVSGTICKVEYERRNKRHNG